MYKKNFFFYFSSVQKELEASKYNLTLRNTSSIKKILTSNLPKSGKFLSTKSLQRLSVVNKKVGKNPKYSKEVKTELADFPKPKKKVVTKVNKNSKDLKLQKKDKLLNKKNFLTDKQSKKRQRERIKDLKKENSLKKLGGKEIKNSSKRSVVPKVLKKKVLQNNSVIKKKEVKTDKVEKFVKLEIAKNKKVKGKLENEPTKVLKSRSGRLRKIKDVSTDFVVSKNKEEKILSPPCHVDILSNSEIKFQTVPVEETKKLECGKDNKSRVNTDLLQNVLSESVESWFDMTPVIEKKGRGKKVKIVPKRKETEVGIMEKKESELEQVFEGKSSTSETTEEGMQNIENTDTTQVSDCSLKKEDSEKLSEVDEMKPDEKNVSENPNPEIDKESSENNKLDDSSTDKKTLEKDAVKSDVSIPKRGSPLYGKKVKPLNRQLMGYKKKRRKIRKVLVSKRLKNYGEKIDFGVPITEEQEKEKSAPLDSSEFVLINGEKKQIKKMNKDDEISTECEDGVKKLKLLENSNNGNKSARRSRSEESHHNNRSPIRTRRSAEMPESLPSRKVEFNLTEIKCSVNLNANKVKDFLSKNSKNKGETVVEEEEMKNNEKETENLNINTKNAESNEIKMEKKVYTSVEEEKIKSTQYHIIVEEGKVVNYTDLKVEVSHPASPLCDSKNNSEDSANSNKHNLDDRADHEIESATNAEKVDGEQKTTENSPQKKRGRKKRQNNLEEADNKSSVGEVVRERRKSHREIKLTPKLVDMIASSSGHKRCRRTSSTKEEGLVSPSADKGNSETEYEYSNIIKKATSCDEQETGVQNKKKDVTNNVNDPVVGSIENYLQSKMEANASSFECSWEPGDLVWARFAGLWNFYFE